MNVYRAVIGVGAPAQPLGQKSDARFEGEVNRESLGEAEGIGVSIVRFSAGARTYRHSHAGGQMLLVLEGQGQAWTESEGIVDLAPGDVVHAAPGELHWHGAAPASDMTHLSIAVGSSTWEGSPPPPRP